LVAALLMAALTTTLGVLVIQSIVNWVQYRQHDALTAIPQPPLSGYVLVEKFPINLIILDLSATLAVALVILLIGYSVVRHGILIERSLARRGFFEQWRGVVFVAWGVAIFFALRVGFDHTYLGSLLLIYSHIGVSY